MQIVFLPKQICLFSWSATMVTTLRLKQPTCFCSGIPRPSSQILLPEAAGSSAELQSFVEIKPCKELKYCLHTCTCFPPILIKYFNTCRVGAVRLVTEPARTPPPTRLGSEIWISDDRYSLSVIGIHLVIMGESLPLSSSENLEKHLIRQLQAGPVDLGLVYLPDWLV